MPRKPVTDPHKAWNIAHSKRLEAYNKRIEQLLNRAITQCADLALRHGAEATPEKPFTYAQDRQLKAETERLLRDLSDEITMVTKEGEGKEWEQAYKQATEYLSQVYNVAKQTEALQAAFDERLLGMKTRNLDALNAFQNRKIGGLKLSDKVWNYTQDFEKQMEVAIDQALLEGKSAQSLSRDIRSLLLDPDALFRRVRDDDDQLRMSRAMAAYHPGQGRYRSAYMNAMRLARSEINIAYRSSDSQTAQEFDACVGIEVHLSNNHNCKGIPEGQFYDICDELQGRYPKDFKFVGWHPACRCYTTYILKSDEEFWDDIMSGENNESINTVDDVPDNFKKWLSENKERIEKAEKKGTLPYFLRDNKVYWDYIETPATPVISIDTTKLSIQERAAIRHAARTQEEIDRIKAAWQKRLEIPELDGSIQQLKGLNKSPQRRSDQTWEEYLEEWYNYGEKLYGKNSSIGKGIDFWRNSPSNSESVIRSRINYLQTSISAPAGIGDIDAILRYDTDKLPWQWRTTYAKFIRELNANASMIETDGVFGFANTFKHREIESLANMINLTKNDDAVRYGLDKLSWKTPAIFFNGNVMKFGERYLLPDKKFFDSLSEFVPMTTHNGYKCFYYPSDRKVHIGMGKKAVERVTKSRWQAKNVMHHEFTHANDALNDWCNNKDVVDWWDAFVKKVNDTDYGKELEEKIKELNSKKHTADQEEQLGKLSDILQAAKKDHAFIEPRGHEKSYYSSKEKQIKEFLAHCGEAYWGGNPVIKELDEDLYKEMLKVMNMLVG